MLPGKVENTKQDGSFGIISSLICSRSAPNQECLLFPLCVMPVANESFFHVATDLSRLCQRGSFCSLRVIS